MFLNLEEIAENSFFDFHTKGLDYLCLRRDPKGVTEKLYFLPRNPGGVVFPHNHRYPFQTTLVSGRVDDCLYEHDDRAPLYNERKWYTPLTGGSGWTEEQRPVHLKFKWVTTLRDKGQKTSLSTSQIHTLRPLTESIIHLTQWPDEHQGLTFTYIPNGEELPNLDGLYRKPTVDEVRDKLKTYLEAL